MRRTRSTPGSDIVKVLGEVKTSTPRRIVERARELGKELEAVYPDEVEALSGRSGMDRRARSREAEQKTLIQLLGGLLVCGVVGAVVALFMGGPSVEPRNVEAPEEPARAKVAAVNAADTGREDTQKTAREVLRLAQGDEAARTTAVAMLRSLRAHAAPRDQDVVAETETRLRERLDAARKADEARAAAAAQPAVEEPQAKPEVATPSEAPIDSAAATDKTGSQAAKEPPKRLAVPGLAECDKAERLVKEVYADDLKKTKPDELAEVASKLLDQARSTADDMAARYILLREATDLAVRAGDTATVVAAATEVATTFDVNAIQNKWTQLARIKVTTQTASATLAAALSDLAVEAVAADDYEVAVPAMKAASERAAKSGDSALVARIKAQQESVKETKKAFDAVAPAMARLAIDANDADANLARGLFLCLNKGAWEKGLPLLAKGSHPGYQEAARLDLANDDASALKAGDAWWDLGEAEKGARAATLHARAVLFYERVVATLSGLTQMRLQKRIDSVAPEARIAAKPQPAKPQQATPSPVKQIDFSDIVGRLRWISEDRTRSKAEHDQDYRKLFASTNGKPGRLVGRFSKAWVEGGKLRIRIDHEPSWQKDRGFISDVDVDLSEQGKIDHFRPGDFISVEGVFKYEWPKTLYPWLDQAVTK